MKQTGTDDHNREKFYATVYPIQNDCKENLIDISSVTQPIIAIDCCGWHYAEIFKKPILMLETLNTLKNYRLERKQFTKIIDDRNTDLVWPKLPNVVDPIILLDRAPILNYCTISELAVVINDIIGAYDPSKIFIRGRLHFIDDSRMQDRLCSWQNFLPVSNFVTVLFHYDTDTMTYKIILKRFV